jgi:hypothetical protein
MYLLWVWDDYDEVKNLLKRNFGIIGSNRVTVKLDTFYSFLTFYGW